MKKKVCDILVVGGGLSGLLTAYAISLTGLKIIIIDQGDFDINKKYLSDLRTTAVAEGSKEFFQKIFLWPKIKKYAEPIGTIKVFDRKIKNSLFFEHTAKENLGYVIKNSIIRKTIIDALKVKKNVKMLKKTSLKKLQKNSNNILATVSKGSISASLLISADGKNSFVRSLSKTKIIHKKYDHSALVVNISHSKNHNNIAHEIFLKSGPLAILPMKSESKNNHSSSVIWSNPKEYSLSLEKINDLFLKKTLEEKINQYVGVIKKISQAKFFPLTAHVNKRFYEERLIYVGDSAHSLHPIAGQGWNLGIRDIKNLLSSINLALELGLDCGSEFVCKKYNNESYGDAYSLFQITDKLNSIFLNENVSSKLIRSMGFNIINKNKSLKKFITNYAMGI